MKRLLFSVTICLIAVMPFAFPILINKTYDEAYIYIPIIMIATYYSNLSSYFGGIFSAYKDTKIMGTTTIGAAIINLIIDLLLVQTIGIYAACISTLIADLIIYIYRKNKLKKYIKLRELKFLGPCIIMIIICFAYYTKYMSFVPNVLYWILNIISLLIAITYSIVNNYNLIKPILNKLKRRD